MAHPEQQHGKVTKNVQKMAHAFLLYAIFGRKVCKAFKGNTAWWDTLKEKNAELYFDRHPGKKMQGKRMQGLP